MHMHEIGDKELAFYMSRGRRLRSLAMLDSLKWLARAFGFGAARRARGSKPKAVAAE